MLQVHKYRGVVQYNSKMKHSWKNVKIMKEGASILLGFGTNGILKWDSVYTW